jgi:DNA-directed RNA polymerase specialized sigma24 family protein
MFSESKENTLKTWIYSGVAQVAAITAFFSRRDSFAAWAGEIATNLAISRVLRPSMRDSRR